jgi:hypothetical protein
MTPSSEVTEAVGHEGDTLKQRAERLRRVVGTKSTRELAAEELAQVEAQIVARDEAALTNEAKARLIGIARALGSLADQSRLDNARLLEAARKFADHVEGLNERYEKCLALRHEAAALAEVFDLPMPVLSTVTVPALRPEVQQAFETTSRVGVRDNGHTASVTEANGRRTYAELGDVPGGDLIRRKRGA